MKAIKGKSVDMTNGTVWKQLVLFAVPLILGDVLQQLYSTTDSVIVGQFIGKEALAAVTSTETLINTVIGMFTGMATGCTIVIAQCFGAGDREKLSKAVHTTAALAVLIGLGLTSAGLLGVDFLLHVLNTPPDVYAQAKEYLTTYFAGLAGLVLYNMCSGILRAVGDSRRPLIALMITSFSNILLDLLFVIRFGWGVRGAALATILAQFASALFLIGVLLISDDACRVEPRRIRVDRQTLKQILGIGMPIGIQKSLVAFSNLLVLAHVNYFGSAAAAGWGIYRKLDQLIMNIIQNLALAISTFVGQNHGAGKEDRIREGARTARRIMLGTTLTLSACMLLFRHPLIRLFNRDPYVLSQGSLIFSIMFPLHFLTALSNTEIGLLRGRGDARGPMLIMMSSYIVLRQIYLNVGWIFWKSIAFAVSCYPFAWGCTALMMYCYRRKHFGRI